MTCTLWINFFDGTKPFDMLIRFNSRSEAKHYAKTLFDTHALNIKKPTAKELFATREQAVVRSDFSVWNPQGIFNPHLPAYDCTEKYAGSDIYKHDFPIDRMRDWNNEVQVSGGGYFWLSLIRALSFGANIYLADNGFEPVQKYLNDRILQEVTNYKQIAYVSTSAAADIFNDVKDQHVHLDLDREAPYDLRKRRLTHAELDAELDTYFA
jgi:hypothetical protein